jgi:hypothetical protein
MNARSVRFKDKSPTYRLTRFQAPRLFADCAASHIEFNAAELARHLEVETDPFERFLLQVTHGTAEGTYARAKLINEWCRRRKSPISIEQAKRLVGWLGSYDVARTLASLCACMEDYEWWQLFGERWSGSDSAYAIRDFLFWKLSLASQDHLRSAMSDRELTAADALPRVITVYRGCYAHNTEGLSWSLSRKIASAFPTFLRYSHPSATPLLVTGEVDRRRIILKLDRNEHEVLSADVEAIAEQQL